jgi:hypothetical protein
MAMNAKRAWRDIQETTNPEARLAKVRSAREWIRDHLAKLTDLETRLARENAELARHPGRGSGVSLQLTALTVVSAALVVLDIPVQFLLNSASLPDVDRWIIGIASPAIAIGLAGLVHGASIAFLHDKDRPARSIRICRVLAALSFLATASAATLVLFARQASESMVTYLVTLTSVSLWTLAESLPLAAGFFSAWAHMLAYPRIVGRRLEGARVQLADLKRWSDELEREEGKLAGERAANDSDVTTESRRGIAAVGVLLFALMSLAPSATAQESPVITCAIFVDRTKSLDPVHRSRAIEALSDALPEFVRTIRCAELIVGSFADEGAWAPRQYFRVPQPPALHDCAATSAPGVRGTASVLAGIAGFREHYRQLAVRECEAEHKKVAADFEQKEKAFLSAVRAVIRAPQLAHETATDLVGMLMSMAQARIEVTIVLTDGVDTVHDKLPSLPFGDGCRAVLVLVPTRAEYGGPAVTEAVAERWRRSGVAAIRYPELVGGPAGLIKLSGRRVPISDSSA